MPHKTITMTPKEVEEIQKMIMDSRDQKTLLFDLIKYINKLLSFTYEEEV